METDDPTGLRSGLLVSPLPPRPSLLPAGSPRYSASRPRFGFPKEPSAADLLTLAPLQSITGRPGRKDLLSWVSVHIFRHACWKMCLSPLHRHARKASTPATTASRRFGSEGSTPEFPFRPRGFAPPRRFPPLHESRACCIPLPILGFSAFPPLRARSEDRKATGLSRGAGSYPSKESPPTVGMRHRIRFESFGSGVDARRCQRARPTPSWALPLQGSFPATRDPVSRRRFASRRSPRRVRVRSSSARTPRPPAEAGEGSTAPPPKRWWVGTAPVGPVPGPSRPESEDSGRK